MNKKAQDHVFSISGSGVKHAPEHPNCPYYTTEEVLEQKHYSDYSPEVRRIIDVITIGSDLEPVGSSKFAVHKYPSDIDLFEPVIGCCTVNSVRLPMARNIQAIILRVQRTRDMYFSRFQCGYDRRYDVYFGREQNGKLVDYEPFIARREIVNLYEQGLLTNEESDYALELARSNPSLRQFFGLYWFFRDMMIVDWSQEEILAGYKQLRAGKKLYLDDALIDKSLVKLDVRAKIPYPDIEGKRFVEFTNWFLVEVENEDGNIETLSIVQQDRVKSLRADIYRYIKNDPLKAAKRYWNYLFELEQTSEVLIQLQKLAPLFSCYVAFLNSILTDLELQKEMMESGLISSDGYRKFLGETRKRMKDHAPNCYFDFDLNNKLMKSLNPAMIKETIKGLTNRYLSDKHINMIDFVSQSS